MRIRRTTVTKSGTSISLPFIEAIADEHPEAIDAPPPAPPSQEAERRGPRMRYSRRVKPEKLSPPKPKRRERGPAMTEAYIRRVLGKPEPRRADEAQYERMMRRIMREGV